MPPVSSVLGNCVVCKEAGIKASPSAACARGTGRDGLAWEDICIPLDFSYFLRAANSAISRAMTNIIDKKIVDKDKIDSSSEYRSRYLLTLS